MPTLQFDGHEYDFDVISDESKRQIASVQFADKEIDRLKAQLAFYQSARSSHINTLRHALTNYGIIPEHLKQ